MPSRYAVTTHSARQSQRCHALAISARRASQAQTAAEFATAILLCAFSLSFAVTLLTASVVRGQDGADSVVANAEVERRDPNQATFQALEKELDFAFEETSLEDVVKDLGQRTGVPIQIDVPALEDVGLDGTAKISSKARNLSLRAGLNHMLRYWDLTWTVRNGKVSITTPEVAETELDGHFYNVRDLVCDDGGLGKLEMDALVDLIETTVRPDCWDTVGGPCSLDPFHELLIVHCLRDTHCKIDGLLVGVRELKRRYAANPDAVINDAVLLPTTEPGEAIRVTLEQKIVELSFSETPLDEAADRLSEQGGVPIVIDRRALEEVGLLGPPEPDSPSGADPFGGEPGEENPFGGDAGDADPFGGNPSGADPFGGDPGGDDPFGGSPGGADPFDGEPNGDDPFGGDTGAEDPFGAVSRGGPIRFCSIGDQLLVSFQADNVPLRAALIGMLQPLDLVWIIRDDAIVITTPEESEHYLSTRVYPVRDLVADQDGLCAPNTYGALIDVVHGCVSPDSWDVVGGPGSIQPLQGLSALVVSQTEKVHQEVADVLAGLRRGRADRRPDDLAGSPAEGAPDGGMIFRVYHLQESDKPLDATCVNDLLAIARDLAAPRDIDQAPTSYVHKFGNAIVVHHRVGIHREFGKLLTRLNVQWRTSSEEEVTSSLLPIVGDNGQSPGGFFNVERAIKACRNRPG